MVQGSGASIDVPTHGDDAAGTIRIEADSVLVSEGGLIGAISFGDGDAGTVEVHADSLEIRSEGSINAQTNGAGNGGTIRLGSELHPIDERRHDRAARGPHPRYRGGWVDSTSLPYPGSSDPSGNAGAVTLDATGWIQVSGDHDDFGLARVSSSSLGSGAAGALTLRAPRIAIDEGAVMTTAIPSALGLKGIRGGAITLDATRELLITNGGRVDASTFIPGEGGSIQATAGRWIRVEGKGSGIASRTGGTGLGGTVSLLAPRIEVRRGGEVSAASAQGFGPLTELFDPTGPFEGLIITEPPAEATGNAGSIELAATKLVHLDNGDITTSVGVATGGNITIDPEFVILENNSSILATAGTGHGGFIRITADNYFAFPGSVVSADSEDQELSGVVELHAPDVDLAGNLTELPTSYLDAASLMRARCAARRCGEASGSFAVRGAGGIPPEPDGWLRASVSLDAAETTSATPAAQPALFASLGPLLAEGSCE